MKSLSLLAAAVAIAFSAGEAIAQSNEAPCEKLSVRVRAEDSFGKLECLTMGQREPGINARTEIMESFGITGFFVIVHTAAGRETYVMVSKPKEFVERIQMFGKTENWGEPDKREGYGVHRFRGTHVQLEVPYECLAFTRGAGHIPQTMGYRHVVSGVLCRLLPESMTEAAVDEFLDGIDTDF